MRFAIISPASGLQRWATKSTCHLVLSHVVNPVYQQFYRQRSQAGDLVILDNGAYEGEVNANQLLERIGLYHPKVVVLPDMLGGDARDSYNLARGFHEVWKSKLPMQWMFVPQGRTSQEFYDFTNRAINDLGVEWVGIPRIFGTHLNPQIESRARFCEWIHERWPDVNVHCLGMLAGNIAELPLLEKANCQSIDSSAPVWRGWCGFDIEDPAWQWRGTDCDFDAYPVSGWQTQVVINLRKCGVIIND